MSPMYGMGGLPAMGQIPGGVGWPASGFPNTGQMPGYWTNSGWHAQQGNGARTGYLDGVWELANGSLVVIKRDKARLFVERDRHQDFVIGYDGRDLWWTPRGGNTTTKYRYQMRDGRMVLRDNSGKVLLMRRRS